MPGQPCSDAYRRGPSVRRGTTRASRRADVNHHRLDEWFATHGWQPFTFQREVWNAYRAGESGLVHAATGTGKTLAAWGGALEEWFAEQEAGSAATRPNAARKGARRDRSPALRVLWITPLRALAADTEQA